MSYFTILSLGRYGELRYQGVVNHLIQEMFNKLSGIESMEVEIELNDNAVPHSAGDLTALKENLSQQFIKSLEEKGSG